MAELPAEAEVLEARFDSADWSACVGWSQKMTVTNRGDRPALVPALLADDKNILWADSLVVIDISTVSNRGATCLRQGAGAIAKAKDLRPVERQPGESVSAEVDVRHARGVAFHPGGTRYYFHFCLGEKSATSFFYFRS